MLVDLQRFVEFAQGGDWKTREGLTFEPVTINTDYIGWFKRWDVYGHDFCETHFTDRGGTFILDLSYEQMRRLLGMPDRPPGIYPSLASAEGAMV